jgi:hypothetical protein
MASPAMKDYFIGLAKEHRALAATTTGPVRSKHQEKADQYERLGGARDLYRKRA